MLVNGFKLLFSNRRLTLVRVLLTLCILAGDERPAGARAATHKGDASNAPQVGLWCSGRSPAAPPCNAAGWFGCSRWRTIGS